MPTGPRCPGTPTCGYYRRKTHTQVRGSGISEEIADKLSDLILSKKIKKVFENPKILAEKIKTSK